jgi:hypothetical protein
MTILGIPRKDLSFGNEAETVKKWTASSRDVEVTMLKRQETYSILSFIVCPPRGEAFSAEEHEILFGVDAFETTDLREAEEEFNKYHNNFI